MTRPMTSAMSTALSGQVIRPVLIAYLDILSDPISMWTGAGTFVPTGSPDAILNGKTFYSSQSFADVSDIKEDQGIGGPVTIILKAEALDQDALRQIVRDRRQWRGRAAYLWMGLYNESLNAVLEYPIRIKTGIMASVSVVRSKAEVYIELVIDADLQNAKTAPFRLLDHGRVWSGDTFSSFIIELSNKPAGLERPASVSKSDSYGSETSEAYIRDQMWQ
jgi:hypothetical protein